jgi:hypothetical protein
MVVVSLVLAMWVMVDDVEVVVDNVGCGLIHFLLLFGCLAHIFIILAEITTEMWTMLSMRLKFGWLSLRSVLDVLLGVLGMLDE